MVHPPQVTIQLPHLLGATLAYVPSGHATLRSVLTTALPPAGTVTDSAAARSNPADRGEPRTGIFAFSLRSLTCMQPEGGMAEDDVDMAIALGDEEWERRMRATRAEVSRRCCRGEMVENCGVVWAWGCWRVSWMVEGRPLLSWLSGARI